MTGKLEENLKKIEETKEKLLQSMEGIDNYHGLVSPHGDNDIQKYKKYLDKRDNLAISLDYLQNDVIIEQNKEIINNLNALIRGNN